MTDGFGSQAPELKVAIAECRRFFFAVGIFSIMVNVLMLTGPLFMLQVYDRVLPSRSESTLVTLAGIVAYLFFIMGLLDYVRGRVLARVGARIHRCLDRRVLEATFRWACNPGTAQVKGLPPGIQDLDAIQRWVSGPGPIAFLDAPWLPVFVLLLYMFHEVLGLYAAGCAVLLIILAVFSFLLTSRLERELTQSARESYQFVDHARAAAETMIGVGLLESVLDRVTEYRKRTLLSGIGASDRRGAFSATTKTLRMFMQSMMLGVGAWLAVNGAITPGVMIAATILLGRALAPVDQAVAQWPQFQSALQGYRALSSFLRAVPEVGYYLRLPAPNLARLRERGQALLELNAAVVTPPGARLPVIRGVSFSLQPGQVIGIAGASGSGKTTLAKSIVGLWPPVSGSIHFASAPPDQYDDATRARCIGWLPQNVVLFPGSLAENIARLDATPDEEAVIRAARMAGVHEMILDLPGGYEFQIKVAVEGLSGSQRQQIALARTFYGDPALAVLDEGSAHLDRTGILQYQAALKMYLEQGGAAVVLSHDPVNFQQCDALYNLQEGLIRPMQVLRHLPSNPQDRRDASRGGDHTLPKLSKGPGTKAV